VGRRDRTYGAASCYGVTLVTGDERYEEVHAIVPDRTHHDDDQLELIAPSGSATRSASATATRSRSA